MLLNLGAKCGLSAFREKAMDTVLPGFYGDLSRGSCSLKGPRVVFGQREAEELGADMFMETGFFRDAVWLDKMGMYAKQSLNSSSLPAIIDNFSPPDDIIAIVVDSDVSSKYEQGGVAPIEPWNGYVFASQVPHDMQIQLYGEEYYWRRMEKCCEILKDKLFIKIHPKIKDTEVIARMRDIAGKYGSTVGWCDMSDTSGWKEVLCFNSGFVVDCWMRGIPTHTFSNGSLYALNERYLFRGLDPFSAPRARKVVNFLMWKYCLPIGLTAEQWEEVFNIYHASDELFPLPVEYSWGYWFKKRYLERLR